VVGGGGYVVFPDQRVRFLRFLCFEPLVTRRALVGPVLLEAVVGHLCLSLPDGSGRSWVNPVKAQKGHGIAVAPHSRIPFYSCVGGNAKHFRGGEVARGGDGVSVPVAGTADSSCLASLARRNDKIGVVARASMR